jgi:hypothetical protein
MAGCSGQKVYNHRRSRTVQLLHCRICLNANALLSNTFVDASDEVCFNDVLWGSCLISFDSNRDGWLDLVQVNIGHSLPEPHVLRLLENRETNPGEPKNNYLVIRQRMCGINRRAIGATVEVAAGGLTMMRLIFAGCCLIGQEPAEAFFGLGPATIADSVLLRFGLLNAHNESIFFLPS